MFLGMARSPSVEAQIQRWVGKLDRAFDRIQHCSAWIEQPHVHDPKKLFEVRVEIDVPGDTLVVSRKGCDTNAHAAISNAFRAARRRLHDHARIKRQA